MAGSPTSEGLKASAEIAKQVITLSTAAVAFTVTFLDKFTAHASGPFRGVPQSLYVAWGLFGLSILFSLWTLMAITGTLVSLDRAVNGWQLTESQADAAKGAGSTCSCPHFSCWVPFCSPSSR
jgi:hypothetical protein